MNSAYSSSAALAAARGRRFAGAAFGVALIVALMFYALSMSVYAPLAGAASKNLDPFMGGKAQSAQFASPQGCSCHSDLQSQWQTSMHALSLKDPFYKLQTSQVEKDAGKDVAKFCDTCHAPAAVMSGGIQTAEQNDALDGITCTVCHQVTAQHGKTPGNASLAYPKGGPNGVLHAQIMDPQAPHQASGNKLFNTSEYCGACHNVTHPANGLKLETTYDEWKKSDFAKQGVTCQKCHMASTTALKAPEEGQAAMGAPTRKDIYAMTFVGANVAQGDKELATALLKKAAKVEVAIKSDILPAGQEGVATVKVTNTGAGHSIPTGLTEVRNMWLTVSSVDAQGKKTEIGRTEFGTKLTDEKGKEVGAKFWLGAKKKSDNRIKPGETFTQEIKVTMPASAQQQTLVAELNYQSAKDDVIAPSGVKNPTTVMASASKDLFVSEAAKAAAAKKQTETKPKTNASQKTDDSSNEGVLPAVAVSAIILVTVIVVLVIIRKRQEKKM